MVFIVQQEVIMELKEAKMSSGTAIEVIMPYCYRVIGHESWYMT